MLKFVLITLILLPSASYSQSLPIEGRIFDLSHFANTQDEQGKATAILVKLPHGTCRLGVRAEIHDGTLQLISAETVTVRYLTPQPPQADGECPAGDYRVSSNAFLDFVAGEGQLGLISPETLTQDLAHKDCLGLLRTKSRVRLLSNKFTSSAERIEQAFTLIDHEFAMRCGHRPQPRPSKRR